MPQQLKAETPLLKKDELDVNSMKYYRPVSSLPYISKTIEKVVLKQLNEHMAWHDLMHPLKSAYCAGHSTETAVVKIKICWGALAALTG